MKKEPVKTCAAIMFSDIVGYTAMMGEDEDLAFRIVKKNIKIHHDILRQHNGKLIKEIGDGVLCSFSNATDAVTAAYELQKHYFVSQDLRLRIGIHFGEIIMDRHDVFGDAVNIASRLQTLGTPGSILFSGKIREDIAENQVLKSVPLGKFNLKNVKEKVELFALSNYGLDIPKRGVMLKLLESRLKKGMIAGLVFLSFLLVGLWVYHNSFVNSLATQMDKSIAVLPFQNINNTEDDDFFIDGLTQDIIIQLSKISALKVISKSSSDYYRNSKESFKEIARSLDVRYLLEGNVQRQNQRIKIWVQVIDVNASKAIWAETYQADLNDVFKLQSDISKNIAESMSAQLSIKEILELQKKPTESISAYEFYLKGREYYYKYEPSNNQKAIVEFKKALEVDPDYALAWAGLGDAFSQNFRRFKSEDFWFDSAITAGEQAISIDSNLSEGYKSLSTVYSYKGDHSKSFELLQKALLINPNNPQAIGNLATVYLTSGELDKALFWQKKAAGLNPRLYIPFQLIGWTYRVLGDYENAVLWLKKSLNLSKEKDTYEQLGLTYIAQNKPDSALNQIPKLLSLIDTTKNQLGGKSSIQMDERISKIYESAGIISFFGNDLENAKTYFQKSVKFNPAHGTEIWAYSPIYLGYLIKSENNTIDAEVLLSGALHLNLVEVEKNTQDTEVFFNLSSIYAILGNHEKSLQFLRKAHDLKWVDTFMVTHNPIFKDLWDNKEFKGIVQNTNSNIIQMREMEIQELATN